MSQLCHPHHSIGRETLVDPLWDSNRVPQKINIMFAYLINHGHSFLPLSQPASERTLSMWQNYRKIATQTYKMSLFHFVTTIYLSAIRKYLKYLCEPYLKDEFLESQGCQYIFHIWRKCYLFKTGTSYLPRVMLGPLKTIIQKLWQATTVLLIKHDLIPK